jgi:hypothetical protein
VYAKSTAIRFSSCTWTNAYYFTHLITLSNKNSGIKVTKSITYERQKLAMHLTYQPRNKSHTKLLHQTMALLMQSNYIISNDLILNNLDTAQL